LDPNIDDMVDAMVNNTLQHELSRLYYNVTYRYRHCEEFVPFVTQFVPMSDKWGQFEPEKRRINLHQDLFKRGGWEAVRGVFLHEVAHQLVYQFYPKAYRDEPPHGRAFRNMAESLNLNEIFIRASLDIRDDKDLPPNPIGKKSKDMEGHPVLSKVKKLLALSGSSNQNEAAAALAAAERLLSRHNLSKPETDGGSTPFERWRLKVGCKRVESKLSYIASILHKFFFVECIFVKEFDPMAGEYVMRLEILGKPVNLAMAEHVFHFLEERAETLWLAFKPTAHFLGESGRGAKNTFVISMLSAFEDKLHKERKEAIKATPPEVAQREMALVESDGFSLKCFLRECYPRTRTANPGHRPNAPNSARAGRKAGEDLTIHTPVQGGRRGPQGYLES
jgi:hypothetical protein